MEWTETEIEDLKIHISRVGPVPSAKQSTTVNSNSSIIVTKDNISPAGRGGISPLHFMYESSARSNHPTFSAD